MKEVKVKIKLLFGMAVALSLVLFGCPRNQVQSKAPGGTASANGRDAQESGGEVRTYSHDANGLEQQFEPFLNASASDNEAAADRLFAVFTLPDASGWFTKYFAKEQVEQLDWDYEAEVSVFKSSTAHEAKIGPVGTRFKVQCSLYQDRSAPGFAPRVDAIVPLQQVAIERYEIEFTSSLGYKSSILANFTYINGAYRYLGKGAYPFWSMPDSSAPKKL
jgi:hypothetical protein